MLAVGPFEMETEAGFVYGHITHSGAQSLLEDEGGCRVQAGGESVEWRR